MWFVSQEGLNRYNGHELENYRYSAANPHTLSSDNVTHITEDINGRIWVSTIGGGLNQYHPVKNTFSALTSDGSNTSVFSNNIYTVFADKSGRIWLGYENAFSSYDPKLNQFKHFFPNGNDIPALGEVRSFAESSDGAIWVATTASGILRVLPGNHSIKVIKSAKNSEKSPVSNTFLKLLADDNGYIWASSLESGLSVIDSSTLEVNNYKHTGTDLNSLSSNKTYDVFQDNAKNIWVGTQEGLNLFDPITETFSRYSISNSQLPDNRIYSVFQSRDGQYWIGTYNGLASGAIALFPKFDSANNNLASDSVNAFAETGDGSFWVGTDEGLNRLRSGHQTFEWINEYTYPGISSSIVMSLLGEDSILWVGTFNGGLNRIDLDTNEVTVFRHSPIKKNSIAANGITSIVRASDGKLYAGTFGGGLSILDENSGSFTNLTHNPLDANSISSNRVIALFEDSLGIIWVGTESGLNKLEPGAKRFTRIFSKRGDSDGISNDMVWAFFEDENQDLWLGTNGGGLNRWQLEDRARGIEKFEHYAENVSLPSSHIYGIQSGTHGNLWLSHNSGVTKLNPITENIKHYGVRDGLQDTEFNMGASFKSKGGQIYFGGNHGYNQIDTKTLPTAKPPPQVSISDIRVMNIRRELGESYSNISELTLGYQDKMVSIEFFAADYSNPDLIQYAYKLEGINPDWVISDSSRVATFTTLPSGNYRLRLAAASPDGTWNWNGASLPIVVNPPPWRSLPAYFIYLGLISVAIFLLVSRQKRASLQAKQRQEELERKVSERTVDLEKARKTAEEANQAKSKFLATMSHEIRTPMHGMIGMTDLLLHTKLTDQQKMFAEAAHRSGESLLKLINEILDYSKVEAAKVELDVTEFCLPKLIEETCYLQAEPARKKGLSLNNIIDNLTPELSYGDPTKLRQIVINLLNNAIKFTHNGHINVRVSTRINNKNRKIGTTSIVVEDTGIGMDSETISKIFDPFIQADASTTREYGGTGLGLSISRHYVELMGGTIAVTSEPEKGTAINLTIPFGIKKNHIKQPDMAGKNSSIYCKDIYRSEMIATHLVRLGLNVESYSSFDKFINDASQFEILVVDFSSLQSTQQCSHALNDIKNAVLITPIDQTSVADEFSRFPIVGAPISSDSIHEALTLASSIDTQPLKIQPAIKNSPTKSIRILVAEDVETNQRIAKEMIQMFGHEVSLANNGKEAVRSYIENLPDLVFMDCQMPIMDGYEAARSIRDHESKKNLPRTPIVALTAGSSKDEEFAAEDAGMDLFVTKPFTTEDLNKVFHQFLGTSLQNTPMLSQSFPTSTSIKSNTGQSLVRGVILLSAIENIREVERQTGNQILPAIFDGFISQMNEKVDELYIHDGTNDLEAIYKTAHAIKSMSANIGAERVRSIAADIERKGRSRENAPYKSLIVELEDEYKVFVEEFCAEFSLKKVS
ncbi:two-component regulator propeller domain-containing protein [Parahaliea mediterranea]|uniref:histidine kinase n=1 Tax=Parahaliea mediterranea TaxID=651086 RepID=A0A939DBI8_9GAMM|nr:two-component regulator propeller domain-containing protein [Parahaliea mediterranea]MBN7795125.1 response regulator [Parahaliea mediterranea]